MTKAVEEEEREPERLSPRIVISMIRFPTFSTFNWSKKIGRKFLIGR